MKTTIDFFKYDELNAFASLLLENNYTLIVSKGNEPKKTYFHFFKDGAMGYVQIERFGGVSFSSEHKPCRHAGTGYSILRDGWSTDMTLENAKKACKRIIWPEDIVKGIKFWDSPEEFVNANEYNKEHYRIIKPS